MVLDRLYLQTVYKHSDGLVDPRLVDALYSLLCCTLAKRTEYGASHSMGNLSCRYSRLRCHRLTADVYQFTHSG